MSHGGGKFMYLFSVHDYRVYIVVKLNHTAMSNTLASSFNRLVTNRITI